MRLAETRVKRVFPGADCRITGTRVDRSGNPTRSGAGADLATFPVTVQGTKRRAATADDILPPADRLVMIVGNYGSGKTEVAVNLCLQLARSGRRVQIGDLDIVNPYFRCREARALMERHGIRVVVPPGPQAWADLPIILPEIRGLLHPPEGTTTVFDVGGDDVGARALASLRTSLGDGTYELWQVINAKRPFTDTVDGCVAMRRAIEVSSRLSVTGLLANPHLIDETTTETVLDGWRLAQAVSASASLPRSTSPVPKRRTSTNRRRSPPDSSIRTRR